MTRLAVDTSVAVPLLVATHRQHSTTLAWWRAERTPLSLSGHALAETYSVLTRLPGDVRLAPLDAARLIRARFDEPLVLDATTASCLQDVLADAGVVGGAVYDGLVALAARAHRVPLATRDARAATTYVRLGVEVRVVLSS